MSKSNERNTNKNKSAAGDAPPGNEVSGQRTQKAGTNGRKRKTRSKNKPLPAAEANEINHPASERNTQNPLPQTEMEVHHHPQLEHKPKLWKEYLLEGFMIFIAVMMGFIAENVRESITNSEHARQLTSLLVQDLKADIVQLDGIYSAEVQIVKNNDTLLNLSQQPLGKVDTKKIQKFIRDSHSMWPFHPSGGAIGAIKNELHLKQFSNSDIISYIAKYESHIELLRTVQDIDLQYQRNYLDPFITAHFMPANLDVAFDRKPIPNGQMRNLTQEDLTQLGADMVLIKVISNEMVVDNRKLKDDAVNLLHYITKEYGLEN